MTEEHPDTQKLENRLNKVWEERDREAMREALRKELDVDEDIPPQIFWCVKCKQDFFPKRVIKVESQDWDNSGVFRYWRAKHCGVWNVRLISQKVKDKFFIKSPSVIEDRRKHKEDLLQPTETGYDMLYKHKNKNV